MLYFSTKDDKLNGASLWFCKCRFLSSRNDGSYESSIDGVSSRVYGEISYYFLLLKWTLSCEKIQPKWMLSSAPVRGVTGNHPERSTIWQHFNSFYRAPFSGLLLSKAASL